MPGLPTATDEEIGFQPPPYNPLINVPGSVPDWASNGKIQDVIIHFNPVIIIFMSLVKSEDLAKAVRSAKKKVMEAMEILDAQSFLVFANKMLKCTPTENVEARDINDILCLFYFILNQEPLLGLQTSTFQTSIDSPGYALHEAVIPRGGFHTFNDFFSRHLKNGMRPIAEKDDNKFITHPAGYTYDNSLLNQRIIDIQGTGIIETKRLPWTIGTLLQGGKFADHFKGASRPVSGRVIEAKNNIQDAAYLEVDQQCRPIRKIFLTAEDIEDDAMCKPETPDWPGYQFLQTGGLVVMENDLLGKVAVLPISMAMVSSVKLSVHVGQELKKGDEISTFLFGGSDIICVFESRAGLKPENFIPSPKDEHSRYGALLARAPGHGSMD
ncbi:phosphatidylserine decarboxylase-domain-containing protein [Colletotrichum cereale]|nr:phosphatidylserine decarboxylase-domain-containing protein [Colletotrichum cereale]